MFFQEKKTIGSIPLQSPCVAFLKIKILKKLPITQKRCFFKNIQQCLQIFLNEKWTPQKIDNNYDEDFREHFCNHYVLVQYELLLIFLQQHMMAYNNHMGLGFFRVFFHTDAMRLRLFTVQRNIQRGRLFEMYTAQQIFRRSALTFHSESKVRKNNTFNNVYREKCGKNKNFEAIILFQQRIFFCLVERCWSLQTTQEGSNFYMRSLPVKVMISRDCRRRKSRVETYKNESSLKNCYTLFLYEKIIKIIKIFPRTQDNCFRAMI